MGYLFCLTDKGSKCLICLLPQEVRPSKLRSLTKLPALSHLALGSTGQAGQGCSAKAAGTGGGGVAAAVSNRCLLALPQCLAKGGTGLKSLSLAQCVHISDEGGVEGGAPWVACMPS